MADNLYPEWMQAACQRCREGLPMRDGEVGCHVRAGQSEWVLRYPECTAPTPERHIKDLTAKLATANEVIRQIAQMFGVKGVRHILADLAAVRESVAGEAKDRVGESPLQKLYDDPAWRSEYDSELAAERKALKESKP